jgi:hypothetical protein
MRAAISRIASGSSPVPEKMAFRIARRLDAVYNISIFKALNIPEFFPAERV